MSALTAANSVAINRHCPSCGSDDTASLRSIWEHGSRESSGIAVGLVGDTLAVGNSAGQSATRAARQAAPPVQASMALPFIMVFGSIVVLIVAVSMLAVPPTYHHRDDLSDADRYALLFGSVVVTGIVALGGVAVGRQRASYNRVEWAAYMKQWSHKWACRRCGNVFIPGLANPPELVATAPVEQQSRHGRFCVEGVDRESRMDTTWHCTANSEANARAKAELEGILVTSVTRC